MKDKNKWQKKSEKVEADKQKTTTSSPDAAGKTSARKTVVVNTKKQGTGQLSSSGDLIGRLGTLIVMIVTSLNTGTIMVTSFIEKVYWKGGVHAALLVFIHIPMIAVMIWFMCKARMQSVYNKVRPTKQGKTINAADIEKETVVYEEVIEVSTNGSPKKTKLMKDGQKVINKVTETPKRTKELNQRKRENRVTNNVRNAEQINKAFDSSGL